MDSWDVFEDEDEIVERALATASRSKLQELTLECPSRRHWSDFDYAKEQRIFNILLHQQPVVVCSSLLKLSLRRLDIDQHVWTLIASGFPKLLELSIMEGDLESPPKDLKIPNLKALSIKDGQEFYNSGSVVEDIVRCCTSLERLAIGNFGDGPMYLESSSLVEVSLHCLDGHREKIFINSCNLEKLCIRSQAAVELRSAGKLATLEMCCARGHKFQSLEALDKLQKLVLTCSWDAGGAFMRAQQFVSMVGNSLRQLEVRGEFEYHPESWTLDELIPHHVEVLCLSSNLVHFLEANKAFQKGSLQELLLLPPTADNSLLEFKLKTVLIDLNWNPRCHRDYHPPLSVLRLLQVLVQLLRCCPRLQRLDVKPPIHPGNLRQQLGKLKLHDSRFNLLS